MDTDTIANSYDVTSEVSDPSLNLLMCSCEYQMSIFDILEESVIDSQ